MKKNTIFITSGIVLILIVGCAIYFWLSSAGIISQPSLSKETIISKNIAPFSFNGSLSIENLEDFGPGVLEGKNARYMYFKLGTYGNIQESIISTATVYTYNSTSAPQEFLDNTKLLWDEKKVPYETQYFKEKRVYSFSRGDQSDFIWAHETHLIQISVDRERGSKDMNKGLEVRDAYINKYS